MEVIMPKIKTHKSASKRFYITANGKIMRNKAYRRHLLINKSRDQKRRLKKKVMVYQGDIKRLKKMIPEI